MKNDYDFIKDKFDNSVKAPDELGKDFALTQIKGVEQKKTIRFPVRNFSAAAVLAVFLLSAVVMSVIFGAMPETVNAEEVPGLERFTNRKAVISALAEAISDTRYNENYFDEGDFNYIENFIGNSKKALLSNSSAESSSGSSAGHNATYVQDINVDEADIVKTTSTHLFYLADNCIEVFTADGKNSKRVAVIKPKRVNKSNVVPQEFYIYGDRLTILEHYAVEYSGREYVRAETFDISDLNNIKLVDSFTQSGWYCSSRMTNGKLYIISNHHPMDKKDLPKASRSLTGDEATGDEATPDEIPPYDIYCAKSPETSQFLVVSEIDTDSPEYKSFSKAILGSADEIYCNEEHLYITAPHYYVSLNFVSPCNTTIFKVDLKDNLKFTASAKIKGRIDDQYSMDEKDGNLRVATTSTDKKGRESNNLYILDSRLKKKGSVSGFAWDESIKAVRYIGDTAYVITYEETDPLFIIDLSNAEKPEIMGNVEISGFSTMLVPVDDNTLLGIGYHTQDEDDNIDMEIEVGLKIVTFDISDKKNPKVLDTKIYKNYDSYVQDNPKALVVNFDRNDYTIPFSHYDYTDDEGEGGAINFRVDNGKIKIVDRYFSKKLRDNITRCAYVGDTIYMFGDFYDENSGFDTKIDSVDYK